MMQISTVAKPMLVAFILSLTAPSMAADTLSSCRINDRQVTSGVGGCEVAVPQDSGLVHGGWTSIDLAAGTIRNAAYSPDPAPGSDIVSVSTVLTEGLTIIGDWDGTLLIPTTLRVTGSISDPRADFFPRVHETRLYTDAGLPDWAQAGALIGVEDDALYYETGEWTWGLNDVKVISSDLSNLIFEFTIYTPVTTADRRIDLNAVFETQSSPAVTAAANFAAQFSIALPDGLSFTSDSGIFLSESAVPEPGTWAMMLLGMIMTGAMLRRRALVFI